MLPETMFAMQADTHRHLLVPVRKPLPRVGPDDVLVRVRACGVCRTDLHVLDADLHPHRVGVVPGHEIVGEVVGLGSACTQFALGQRIGIPWLGSTCGQCGYCALGRENLCDAPTFTGYDRDGGFAQFAAADARYCIALPEDGDDAHLAPLLCAGLIGYRTWRIAGGAVPRRIGLWGFGAAAHIVCQIAVAQGQEVYAFTRPGDQRAQKFARSLGACWAGDSLAAPPAELDAQLIFAPLGELVPRALATVRKGGTVVCGGIHMTEIPPFAYGLLWGERKLQSVANLTREDARAFFALLASVRVHTQVRTFALSEANEAVQLLRDGALDGAAVLLPWD